MKKFPIYRQRDIMDCGATCIRMIARYYGSSIDLETIRELSETTRKGSNLLFLSKAAERIGFRTLGVSVDFKKLQEESPLPCIAHWNQSHFVVVYKVSSKYVTIGDPSSGLLKLSKDDFIKGWLGNDGSNRGILLLFSPTPKLLNSENKSKQKAIGFSFLLPYISQHRNLIFQLVVGLLAGSLLQLILPFLSQSIVDIGIQYDNLNFVYLILGAQLFLFVGKTSLDLFRSWILLHLSTRINISLISDFFVKLMNLPISFFDSKMTGDLMQRIGDHKRIESLITTTSLNVLFSLFNLIIFGIVIAVYSWSIFALFFFGSLLYVFWIVLFLKKRKSIDTIRFSEMGREQSKIIELINGMQEIKLHNAEQEKRWEWEFIQANLFKIEIKNLRLENLQSIGSNFINELKNILITVFAAKLVIDGSITLGMMLAITFIIGQLNSPLQQLLGFIYNIQDARLALERLSEIHSKEEETDLTEASSDFDLTNFEGIKAHDISFRYKGSNNEVLTNLSITIKPNTLTAIVGASGSGKTTLMKILLKYYLPNQGDIKYGKYRLESIPHDLWRDKCGVVMQEGYIFNDTIQNNITIGSKNKNISDFNEAIRIANIEEFIDSLPMGISTKIGSEGVGISTGQKQRILIARAVYKNPDIIFFDEATSALDSTNEKQIMQNLHSYFKERTAIIIAHRLSTVKNADQIVVLDEGRIVEKGTHKELVKLGGSYFNLVKNQLDLERLNADK